MAKKKTDAVATPERIEKKNALRDLIGQTVSMTWGVGSQQVKQITKGELLEVTETYSVSVLEIPVKRSISDVSERTGGKTNNRLTLPHSFVVRYAQ